MELDCFVHPSWQPRIRPASQRREWMEASPEQFAYRCLPLAIANAHGWEVLSPCGFAARWNGGMGVEDVEVRVDPGATPHQMPVSLFGQATLTFHVEGLIRTSPGWNLWVGGSPNSAKDGIAPLGAVIETDWSPYTFTMNWRFTRANEWVRFEEDEPFCFFFPIQRGVLDGVTPAIRPLSEALELADAFARWSLSRNAFQEHVRQTNPTAPADKWQKLYYRGVEPDGAPGAEDHQSKLRLAAFGQPPGFEGKACPAGGTRPAGPPPVAAPPPPEPTPPPVDVGCARTLARREWIMDVATRQRMLSPAASSILRVRDLSAEDFLEEFYAKSWPVVIEGAMDDWPARRDWSPAYLRDKVGAAPVDYQGGRTASADFELYKDQHTRRMPFDRYIDQVTAAEAGGDGNDAYITAYNSGANAQALAPLYDDLGQLDKYLTPGQGMLWIGPAGTFTPLHFDLTNNLLAQVIGRKLLTLLPPSETSKLANNRHVFSDVHDITDPMKLMQFPHAADARSLEVELTPGDLLFIPVGWWHQVRGLEFSAMLTYTNFRWTNDPYATFPGE